MTKASQPSFHVIGDAYVDFFCFLDGDWPETGGDSRLDQPVKSFAGGSSTNTTTHLVGLGKHFQSEDHPRPDVTLHTVLNPRDAFGKILLDHAQSHGFPLINCKEDDNENESTGHCVIIVSAGERSFMTHQGCVETFLAQHVDIDRIIESNNQDVHLHVAGFFNTTGFWNGNLRDQLAKLKKQRTALFPNATTTISLVTQHDASRKWDGGLDQIIPYLDFLIMNELEANRVFRRGRIEQGWAADSIPESNIEEWMSYFSPLNPDACVIVTMGAQGAVAFRDGKIISTLSPAIQVKVVDPTGAGDSFTAGFLHGIWEWRRANGGSGSEMWPAQAVEDGLKWGCAVGTSSVTIRGASNLSKPEDIISIYEQLKPKPS